MRQQYSEGDIFIFTLMALLAILFLWGYAIMDKAHAEIQYVSGPAPIPVNHDKILMIVSNWPFVVQGNVYAFQLRTFDDNQITKTAPLSEFYTDEGYLSGVSIKATLYDSSNDTIHKFSGITNTFGWFEGSVLMENETPNESYHVTFHASYPHMVNSTKTFSFELVDHRDVGENN